MGDDCHEGCDTIIIDVDKEQYDEWRREYDRHRYLARQERNSCLYSIEQVESEDQIIETILSGTVENPQKSQITNDMRIRFRKLFDQLTELEF